MANLTRSQLRTEVQARLGETSTAFFTAANLNQWLADGVDDLAIDVEPLVTSATANLVISQSEYPLPTDAISIKRVLCLDQNSKWVNLAETTWEDLFHASATWESDTAATPTNWYWRQDSIGVYPQPTASRTAAVRILYSYRPAAMAADSDTTGLPEWLDRTVVLYAVYRCRLKDKDEARASATAAEYRHQTAEAKRKINRARKGHAPHLEPDQKPYRLFYQRSATRPIIRSSD